MDNYNNSYHSILKTTTNNATNDVERINMLYIAKHLKVAKTLPEFQPGDKVRHVVNLELFEKGSLSRFSKDVFTITEKKGNLYKLSDNNWYKYYHLSPVKDLVKETQKENRLPTREAMKKATHIQRTLNKEGISLSDITTAKKTRAQQTDFVMRNKRNLRQNRKQTDRLHY